MKIFFDTNILLDYLLYRNPFAGDAEKLLIYCVISGHEQQFSSLSVANLYFIVNKSHGLAKAKQCIDLILENFTVSSVNEKIIRSAYTANWKDFEDAIQYYSALSANADMMVTRDTNGFEEQKIPVRGPAAALEELKSLS